MAKVTAEQFIAALRQVEDARDTSAMGPLHTEDAEAGNVTMTEPERGRAGVEQFWTKYRESFTTVHSEFRNIVDGEDAALMEWVSTVTTAAGVETVYDGVSVLEYRDGLIARFRAYFNPNALTAHHQHAPATH